MKVGTIVTLIAGCIAISACSVDPQVAQARRDALNLLVFPEPADRQGVVMAFPFESGGLFRNLQVVWRPELVSENEVLRRVQRYCRAQSNRLSGEISLAAPFSNGTAELPGEGVVPVRNGYFKCLSVRAA